MSILVDHRLRNFSEEYRTIFDVGHRIYARRRFRFLISSPYFPFVIKCYNLIVKSFDIILSQSPKGAGR